METETNLEVTMKQVKKQMSSRRNKKRDTEWHRVRRALAKDSVRVSMPRAFLLALTHFFHPVSDAMAGDDRPDHGLAMMRRGREYYNAPFYFLYWKLKRAEKGCVNLIVEEQINSSVATSS